MDPWTDRLSEYIDGELAPPEREALERHLAACESCRTALVDLRAVMARARALPRPVPASDLWPGIERRIAVLRPARRRFSFSLPELAAAAILLVGLSGGLVWVLRGPAAPAPATRAEVRDTTPVRGRAPDMALPVSFADETYDRAVADLQRALDEERGRLDPETVKVIERNLATIDAAIEQAQRALASDPSNTYLNGHLAASRRRKLALLRSFSAMADPEG